MLKHLRLQKWDYFVLILPLLSLFPLLYRECLFLWDKQHLQFFPLAFLAVGYFLYTEGTSQTRTTPCRPFSFAFAVVGLLATYASLVLYSSWLAHVSLVLAVFAWSLGRFPSISVVRILGICGLLAITVPAPMGWDHRLIQSLQAISSTACSRLMDIVGIVHVQQGNIIEIASKPLFVEEACSGVDSQYALMAVAGVLLLVGRANLGVSLITILTVPIWAILGNLSRIFLIVVGLEWMNIDLSVGTTHTILGMIVFLFAASAHWSSVQLLNFLDLKWETDQKRKRASSAVKAESTSVATEKEARTLSLRWLLFAGGTLLFLPFGLLDIFVSAKNLAIPQIRLEIADTFPDKRDLPQQIEGWKKSDFRTEERTTRDLLGQHSRTWTYTNIDNTQATLSLDFPFRGWHPLWECYMNAGWTKTSSSKLELSSSEMEQKWQTFRLEMTNQSGDRAVLYFSLFDENGQPYRYDGTFAHTREQWRFERTILSQIMDLKDLKTFDEAPLTLQFQVLFQVPTELSSQQLDELEKFYCNVRDLTYRKSMPAVRNLKQP
jgi:exosortase